MLGRLHRYMLRLFVPLLILLVAPAVLAQEDRTLEPGAAVSGALDAENVAQVYNFTGVEGDVVTLSASSPTNLGLALLLADSSGAVVAQGYENSGTTTLADVSLPADGTYYVTVLSALGVNAGNTFELTFELAGGTAEAEVTAEATPVVVPTIASTPQATALPTTPDSSTFAPGQILTVNGMQIALVWDSLAISTSKCVIRWVGVYISRHPMYPAVVSSA